MTPLVYYVVRQRTGWSVELDGMVKSGHPTREAAIDTARSHMASAQCKGRQALLKIQGEQGRWSEERSFAPTR